VILIGIILIILCFLPSSKFYPGSMGGRKRTQELPRWFGRLWFACFGVWFILTGLNVGRPYRGFFLGGVSFAIGIVYLCRAAIAVWKQGRFRPHGEGFDQRWLNIGVGFAVGVIFLCVGWIALRG
jgi:hypothetical protein